MKGSHISRHATQWDRFSFPHNHTSDCFASTQAPISPTPGTKGAAAEGGHYSNGQMLTEECLLPPVFSLQLAQESTAPVD